MKTITVVEVEDYQAVYVGNDLVDQDDVVISDVSKLEAILEALGLDIEIDLLHDEALDHYAMEEGSMPETLREVKAIIAKGT